MIVNQCRLILKRDIKKYLTIGIFLLIMYFCIAKINVEMYKDSFSIDKFTSFDIFLSIINYTDMEILVSLVVVLFFVSRINGKHNLLYNVRLKSRNAIMSYKMLQLIFINILFTSIFILSVYFFTILFMKHSIFTKESNLIMGAILILFIIRNLILSMLLLNLSLFIDSNICLIVMFLCAHVFFESRFYRNFYMFQKDAFLSGNVFLSMILFLIGLLFFISIIYYILNMRKSSLKE